VLCRDSSNEDGTKSVNEPRREALMFRKKNMGTKRKNWSIRTGAGANSLEYVTKKVIQTIEGRI